jgi:hypothetical protein
MQASAAAPDPEVQGIADALRAITAD